MVFGPCGGVTASHGCEVDGRPCPFCERTEPMRWPTGAHQPAQRPQPLDLPRVIVDFRPDPARPDEMRRAADALGAGDLAVLVGEHVDDLGHQPPHEMSHALRAVGLRPIVTVSGRDRSPIELDRELDALVAAEPLAVHVVTGDHPAARFEPSATARFVTDSMRLADAVRRRGGRVSVAESPAAPPLGWRPTRLLDKQHAGADLAIVNHAGSLDLLAGFAAECRAIGVELPLVAPVPVVTDHRSADSLSRFPGLVLPDGLLSLILGSSDPHRTGIDLAVELGRRTLDSGWFAAVNLSGAATGDGVVARAEVMAEIAARILR